MRQYQNNTVFALDLAAKIDETARFECGKHWGKLEFPPPFGRKQLAEVCLFVACCSLVDVDVTHWLFWFGEL